MSRKTPQASATPSRATLGWWWLLGVAAFLACGGAWLMMMGPHGGGGAVPDWAPGDAPDRALDTFVQKVNERDRSALDLLGPEPVFDDTPVSEQEADARQASFYLRQPGLRVLAIRRGDPGKKRSKGDPPRAVYTLVTRVQGSTPPLTVRSKNGVVESPSRLFMIDPDLVVEVRDGKVHGVRPELHRD